MHWRSRLNTSEASIRYIQMSSINLQTPIIYPSVVFFSIRIVPIIMLRYVLRIIMHGTFYGNLPWPEFCSILQLRANQNFYTAR